MKAAYLIMLFLVIVCLGLFDYRYRLAFFKKPKHSAKVFALCYLVFIIWDLLGIHELVFRSPYSAYKSGIMLFSNFPIEEIFFLIVLVYSNLLIYLGIKKYVDLRISR